MTFEKSAEKIIWEAARKVFLAKGLSGARMQDIADEAGMNKALLHYYYRSKEKLFEQIFEKELNIFLENIEDIFESEFNFFEKIEKMVEHEIETFSQCPELPLFLLNELAQHQTGSHSMTSRVQNSSIYHSFKKLVRKEIERGTIKDVRPEQLFIHLISLTVYPFIAKPMTQAMLEVTEKKYHALMQSRKKEICRFVFDALSVKTLTKESIQI